MNYFFGGVFLEIEIANFPAIRFEAFPQTADYMKWNQEG